MIIASVVFGLASRNVVVELVSVRSCVTSTLTISASVVDSTVPFEVVSLTLSDHTCLTI